MNTTTPTLTPLQQQEIIALFGLDILSEDTLCDVRGALLAAYCAGIVAAESVGSQA